MDTKPSLGSALLGGDEQTKCTVNAMLLSLLATSTMATTSTEDVTRHTRSKRRSRDNKREHKERKRRRKEEAKVEEEKAAPQPTVDSQQRSPARGRAARNKGVDKNKSARNTGDKNGQPRQDAAQHQHKAEVVTATTDATPDACRTPTPSVLNCDRRTSGSFSVPILSPATATSDIDNDFFDYHYYLPTQADVATPVPSPSLRSIPSSPFSSPRSSTYMTVTSSPRSSFSAPLLAPPPNLFFQPPPPALILESPVWSLPSRPMTPTSDYCALLSDNTPAPLWPFNPHLM